MVDRDQDLVQKIASVKLVRLTSRRSFLMGSAAVAAGLLFGCAPGNRSTGSSSNSGGSSSSGQTQSSSGSAGGNIPTLTLATWGGLWLENVKKEIIEPFEQENNCKVNVDTAWPFWPKMAAAPLEQPPMDVIGDNLPHAFRMQAAGMLFDPADIKKNTKNGADMWDFAFKGTGVIHAWSPYGIGYRTDVDNPPTTYSGLWEDRFSGKRGTYPMPNTLGAALIMIAAKIFSGDDKNIEAGLDAIARFRPCKLADFTPQMTGLMERGEVTVAHIHDSDVLQQADQGLPFDWHRATDAPTGVLAQNLSVAKHTKYPELAFKLVDRFIDPAVNAKLCEPFYMRPGNQKTAISAKMQARGVQNTASEIENLWIFDWHWWNDHEDEVVEKYNELMADMPVAK